MSKFSSLFHVAMASLRNYWAIFAGRFIRAAAITVTVLSNQSHLGQKVKSFLGGRSYDSSWFHGVSLRDCAGPLQFPHRIGTWNSIPIRRSAADHCRRFCSSRGDLHCPRRNPVASRAGDRGIRICAAIRLHLRRSFQACHDARSRYRAGIGAEARSFDPDALSSACTACTEKRQSPDESAQELGSRLIRLIANIDFVPGHPRGT
jgi:hypothetical protein